jgi:hypothetical protein
MVSNELVVSKREREGLSSFVSVLENDPYKYRRRGHNARIHKLFA